MYLKVTALGDINTSNIGTVKITMYDLENLSELRWSCVSHEDEYGVIGFSKFLKLFTQSRIWYNFYRRPRFNEYVD